MVVSVCGGCVKDARPQLGTWMAKGTLCLRSTSHVLPLGGICSTELQSLASSTIPLTSSGAGPGVSSLCPNLGLGAQCASAFIVQMNDMKSSLKIM